MNIQTIKEFIIKKYCCNYSLPYYILMVRSSKFLHKLYYSREFLVDTDCYKIINEFLRNDGNLYICLKGAAGDIALYYLYLREILNILFTYNGNIKIIIIGNKKYQDILSLYKKDFPKVDFLYLDDYVFLESESESEIRKRFRLDSKFSFLDLRNSYDYSLNSFFKFGTNIYKYNDDLGEKLRKGQNISKIKEIQGYKYTNINTKKIDELKKYSSNKGEYIICNFENKSYKLAWKDGIKFSDYINKIKKFANEENLKFVINSVYDNENFIRTENMIITKLNFQEIIWLAEHNKIKLFISERNGLNDVFKVFYPGINQIIYYPDYYNPCCDKKVYYMLYKENLKNLDVKDFWHLPGDNIIEDIRGNFFRTIEKYLKKLI